MTNSPPSNTSPDPVVAAVARGRAAAEELAGAVRRAGYAARSGTDLGEALAGGSPVLVVDPGGWEDSCAAWLGAYDRRKASPPAVLFVSASSSVLHAAGPAYGFLPSPPDDGALAAALPRLLKASGRFRSYWPAPLGMPPERDLKRISASLEEATGLEIRHDRRSAFLTAVRTRMVARLLPSAREYARLLERRPEADPELELLASLVTVGETYFWRYAGQLQALRTSLLPALTGRGPPRRLRLWSAGCATGEEAYSLAMAALETVGAGWEFEVVGTDLHRPSLARARAGAYRSRSLRNLPAPLLRKYTNPAGRGAEVTESVRRAVRFEWLNLGGEGLTAWARENGPFDVIFCRNTLIYFSRASARRVLDVFEASLREGGGLFLGASETLTPARGCLRPVRGLGSFYYAREPAQTAAADGAAASAAPAEPDVEVALLYDKGLSLLDVEDFAGARDAFRSLLALRPGDARGHTGLALLLANGGREEEARRHLEKARRRGPELAATHYLLGLMEERSGREAEALLHYRRALGVDPDLFMAHFNRAGLLKRKGQLAGFREEMGRALEILRRKPRATPWITGGLCPEALLDLVGSALAESESAA